MNMLRASRPGRKQLALAAGVAIAALTIVGGPAAANAASAPAPKSGAHTTSDGPAVVAVNCAPAQGGVTPGQAKPLPNKTIVDDANGPTLVAVDCDPELTEAGGPSVVEVPGAVPDLDHVQPGTATALDAVVQPIGGEGKTTTKR